MANNPPPLAERQKPGLSVTLPYPRRLDTCQACGIGADMFGAELLQRWQECDAWDQPTPAVVVLCEPCGKRLIDPHPRLYVALHPWEPMPGAMLLCDGCTLQRDLACTSPAAKANGGPGVELQYPAPIRGFVCVRPRSASGPYVQWRGAVQSCAQRVEA